MVGDPLLCDPGSPKSDADTKGVKPGDEIVSINGFDVNRDDLWKMQYAFSVLRPQPGLRLGLKDPSGTEREVQAMARFAKDQKADDLTGGSGGRDIWDMVREGENQEHLMRARAR